MTIRIAMWSGPRNISTAMLRSWGSRADCYVTDEPLYSHYLDNTDVDHPGRDEVIAHHERDWRKVVAWLTGPIPNGKSVWYQKHMAHHLLPQIDRSAEGWLGGQGGLTHGFLIREPREMLTSLAKVTPNPKLTDTGLPQQLELLEQVRERLGSVPPVVDSKDVLQDPRRTLGRLCEALGVPWDEAMLSWAPGRRETDGVWAKYWYDAVERSTAFEPYRLRTDEPPAHLLPLLADCERIYAQLAAHKL